MDIWRMRPSRVSDDQPLNDQLEERVRHIWENMVPYSIMDATTCIERPRSHDHPRQRSLLHIHRRFPDPTSVTWHLGLCDEQCPDNDDLDHVHQRLAPTAQPRAATPPLAYEGDEARTAQGPADGGDDTELDASNDFRNDQTGPDPDQDAATPSERQHGDLSGSATDKNRDIHDRRHRDAIENADVTLALVSGRHNRHAARAESSASDDDSCSYSRGSISSDSDGVSLRGRRRRFVGPRLLIQHWSERDPPLCPHRYRSPSPIRNYSRSYRLPFPSIDR